MENGNPSLTMDADTDADEVQRLVSVLMLCHGYKTVNRDVAMSTMKALNCKYYQIRGLSPAPSFCQH